MTAENICGERDKDNERRFLTDLAWTAHETTNLVEDRKLWRSVQVGKMMMMVVVVVRMMMGVTKVKLGATKGMFVPDLNVKQHRLARSVAARSWAFSAGDLRTEGLVRRASMIVHSDYWI